MSGLEKTLVGTAFVLFGFFVGIFITTATTNRLNDEDLHRRKL